MMQRFAGVVIALCVAFILAMLFWIVAVLAPSFWFGYEWPSIKGNGPEDFTSLLIVGIVTGMLYPPVRKWIAVELNHIHAKIDHNTDVLHHIVKSHERIPNEIDGVHIDDLRPAQGRPQHKGVT